MDVFGTMPTGQLGSIHMDPPQPVPGVGDGLSLDDLTPEAIEVLLRHAGPGVDSALLAVDLRHAGGALGRPDPRGGVVDHLPGRFLVYAVGIAPTEAVGQVVRGQVAALMSDLQPWAAARDYLNFREVPVPAARMFDPDDLRSLRGLRDDHDPARLLVASHSID
jgi:hypothetical protein